MVSNYVFHGFLSGNQETQVRDEAPNIVII